MSYDKIIKINEMDFRDRSILIIGAGFIAEQYCLALKRMNISRVTVISQSQKSADIIHDKYGFISHFGGYAKVLQSLKPVDLVIVALPVYELLPAAKHAIELGNRNILIEKPAALYSLELLEWQEKLKYEPIRIRIAFNRLVYPNLLRLKELVQDEGGITSCRYTFTEWIHTIDFNKERKEIYERWGISNSLHVISMAHALIGLPRELSTFRLGGLPWHPSGSRFTGSGITEWDIPFSYHADWESAGRWSIEVMTPQNAYRLVPLEDIFRCSKGTVQWEKVGFKKTFPDVKQGMAEEVAVMLEPSLEQKCPVPNLGEAARLVGIAEEIFGYGKKKSNEYPRICMPTLNS